MSKIVISDDLKNHMKISPGKTRVWLNDAGEWSNHKHPGFPHEVSREEILGKEGKEVKMDTSKKPDAAKGNAGGKNTTDPKIQVKVTAKNKKDFPAGVKVGDMVEVDNPDYVKPADAVDDLQ